MLSPVSQSKSKNSIPTSNSALKSLPLYTATHIYTFQELAIMYLLCCQLESLNKNKISLDMYIFQYEEV